MSIEQNKINAGALNEKKLLDELAVDIARRFGTEKEKALKLLKSDISKGLDELKKEIQESGDETLKSLKSKELEKLFFILKGALEVVEQMSRKEIKTLREDVEKSISVEDFKNHIEEYLPPKLIDAAKNPSTPHEHVLGFALGTANSIIATADILYQIGKGILKAPFDVYMIVTGKAKTDSFKDI